MRAGTCVCPVCRRPVPRQVIRRKGAFTCPCCGSDLRADPLDAQISGFVAIGLAATVAYVLGFRGVLWPLVALVLFFPVGICVVFAHRVVPTRLFPANSPRLRPADAPITLGLSDP
ncbi:MAG: hypothetical protein ACRD13_06695, partial [Terriglobales bacterium]